MMMDRLERFRLAHGESYEIALDEINAGQKRSHWMWYIFPQMAGLGHTETAQYYAINNLDEAKEFLADEELGAHLRQITEALLRVPSNDALAVMGDPDYLKLRSSMTLFDRACPECPLFHQVLDKFYCGEPDPRTLELLRDEVSSEEKLDDLVD